MRKVASSNNFVLIRRPWTLPGLPIKAEVANRAEAYYLAVMTIPDGIGETDSIVNLQEKFGLVVGKQKPVTPQKRYEQLLKLKQSVAGSQTPFPKGVYRFKSFEEANAWEMKHILKKAVAMYPETPHSKTLPGSVVS